MNTYIIADLHFGDESIIKIEDRPFRTVEEMDATMIDNWNSVVSPSDCVYVLGDFAAEDIDIEYLKTIIAKLNGLIILVAGNHDHSLLEVYAECGIEVINYPIVFENFWIFSHEPMYITEKAPYANIFGHVHNNPIYKTISIRSFCVCAERVNYTPIPFDEIKIAVKRL